MPHTDNHAAPHDREVAAGEASTVPAAGHLDNSPQLPSRRQLARSTLIAMMIAAGLLITVVLPAEYGLDPTGAGGWLGLTEMGEIKASLALETDLSSGPIGNLAVASPAVVSVPPSEADPATRAAPSPVASRGGFREAHLQLAPGDGKEIKLVMQAGERVQFAWFVNHGVVNFDRHGDSVDPPRDYHGYAKAVGVSADAGDLVAAFDGSHGWFWRNRTKSDVMITLRVDGEYSELKFPQ